MNFHYLGVERHPIDRRLLGVSPKNEDLFLSDVTELYLVDENNSYDGADNSRCDAIDHSGERFTINQCGFKGGGLGYTYRDPITKEPKFAVADGNEISHILIGDSSGNIRKNATTGALFPDVYNFDPFTGDGLVWEKLESFSGSFLLRDGTIVEFIRIRPEDATAPQEEIEERSNLLDTKRGHQPTTLMFTEFEELHFLSDESDYHLDGANCDLITRNRIKQSLVDCRLRYSDIPYEYADSADEIVRYSSIKIKGTIASIVYSNKAEKINATAVVDTIPDDFKYDPRSGTPIKNQ